MTQTQTAIERLALAHRKNAGRGRDAAIADDDAAIVQRRLRMKEREQQLDRKIRINRHPGLFVNANRRIALDRDECAKLLVRQLRDRFRDIVNGLTFLTR